MQIYRIIGTLAAVSHRMGRFRINFVPLNVVLFAVLCVLAKQGAEVDAALALGSALFLVPWGFVFLRRHVIFRRTSNSGSFTESIRPAAEIDMRLSGCLTLDGHTERFIEVPAGARVSPDDVAFFSNIDASSFFFIFRTGNRAGRWEFTLPRGAITDVQRGEMFFGDGGRPAFRLRVGNNMLTRHTFILSFRTVAERELVLSALERVLMASQSKAA